MNSWALWKMGLLGRSVERPVAGAALAREVAAGSVVVEAPGRPELTLEREDE